MKRIRTKPQRQTEITNTALYHSLDFNDNDLEANCDGMISPKQIASLMEQRTGIIRKTVIVSPPLWVATGVFTLMVFASLYALVCFIPSVLFALSITLEGVRRARVLYADIKEGRTESVQGHIELSLPQDGHFYQVRIGDLKFNVKREGVLAFKNGEPYVVYYSPRTKWLLTSEWLREGDG